MAITPEQLLDAAFAAYGGTNAVPTGFVRLTDAAYTIDNQTTGLYATTFHNTETNEYILSFRGTENTTDWANNANRGWPQFQQDLTRIRSLMDQLASLSTAKVHITGHSLGGGLAQFAAYDFAARTGASAGSEIAMTTWNALGGAWGLLANAQATYGSAYNANLLDTTGVGATHYFRFDDLVSQLGADHVGGQSIQLGQEGVDDFLGIKEAHSKEGLAAGLGMLNQTVAPRYLDVTEASQAVAGAVAAGLLNITNSNPLPGIASIIFGIRPLVSQMGGDDAVLQAAIKGAGTVLREGLNHLGKAGLDVVGDAISTTTLEKFVEGINSFLDKVQLVLDAKATKEPPQNKLLYLT